MKKKYARRSRGGYSWIRESNGSLKLALLIVFAFPVGLYLMWTDDCGWPKWLKSAVSVAFAALTYGQYTQDGNTTQLYAIAAAIPVLLYNGKRGALSLKYFFYISYPAHMLLLYAIHYVLANHLLPF